MVEMIRSLRRHCPLSFKSTLSLTKQTSAIFTQKNGWRQPAHMSRNMGSTDLRSSLGMWVVLMWLSRPWWTAHVQWALAQCTILDDLVSYIAACSWCKGGDRPAGCLSTKRSCKSPAVQAVSQARHCIILKRAVLTNKKRQCSKNKTSQPQPIF